MHQQALTVSVLVAGLLVVPFGSARAAGSARIQQSDGSVKTYTNVRISVRDQSMWMTSSDGRGTLILGKAACTKVDALVRCVPYDATLDQNGKFTHIPLQTGTVWLNPSNAAQQLSHSSTRLPSHGVLMSIRTKKGTFVSLTGTIDEARK
jgi:hypothetical protein